MGFLDKLLIGGAVAVVGALAVKGSKEAAAAAKEEQRRRESSPRFIPWLTEQDFALMVGYVASQSPRVIRAEVTGLVVEITVRSNSGLTTWSADLDFNDYGNPSGKYWIRTENDQSPVPGWFADKLAEQMIQRLDQGQVRFG
ncbi:hypothetical protein [Microbacterium murale]|uniref:Secreted protein n=1 Tax=Microbacterium murale TaxID=1081040 RepID=A0ABQ1RR47_9MICO|nr:hypothetical protein [Microbacterium murale]GGD76644.1 hypothetical protein GCM10007269_19490 [Microbacterium murale]